MERQQSQLDVEWIPIDRVHGNPANPRLNDEAVPHVAASLQRFGWRQPLVAKRSGEVIAGNTRLKAARSLGQECVPVVWFDGPDIEAAAYAIADNRTGEFAEWDGPALAALLKELDAEDALEGVGYSGEEIDELLAELGQAPAIRDVDDPGPEPPPTEPVSRRGDLWMLGGHRLLCGDSTSHEDMTRLMGREQKASLLATDPPYLVDYQGEGWDRFEGDDEAVAFYRSWIEVALPHCQDDVPVYQWHAHRRQALVERAWEEAGLLLHQQIIWAKPVGTFGRSVYRWRHEPCAFGWRQGNMPPRVGGQLDTVWECDWEGRARAAGAEHPTQKPVRVFEIPMEQHTRRSAIVLEPFSGSGSQIIAAERLWRCCRAMEIEPAFVDVAVRRWEAATGRKAMLLGASKTFSEVSEERGHGAQAAG